MKEMLVALWLVPCAIQDWRRHEISNWLTVPPFLLACGLGAWQALHGNFLFLIVLGVAYLGFRLGWIGPADGKIIASLAAFSPPALFLGFAAMALWFGAKRLRGEKDARLPAAVGFAAGAAVAAALALLGLTGPWDAGIILGERG